MRYDKVFESARLACWDSFAMVEDKYQNFDALRKSEQEGVDFRISVHQRKHSVAIVAPHGGGIEPKTSSIAAAIGNDEFSCYLFEGIKRTNNRHLHITSHRFDEPQCTALTATADTVVTIHGRDGSGELVEVGGLDAKLRDAVCESLQRAGFTAEAVAAGSLSGTDKNNICNKGRANKGVQLEITDGLRETLTGERLAKFAGAVREAIGSSQ